MGGANALREQRLRVVINTLKRANYAIAARVCAGESRRDVAATSPRGDCLVVRVTSAVQTIDYANLSTMLSEGPFTRAVLVYCEKESSEISDEIETWWIGDIEELAASLAAEARGP